MRLIWYVCSFWEKNHNNILDIKFVHAIFKMMHVLKLNHSLQNKCKIIYCFHHQNIKLDWKLLQHRSFSNFLLSWRNCFLYHFGFKYGDNTFHSRLCILQVSQSQEEVWLCLQIMVDTPDPSTVGEDACRFPYWQCKPTCNPAFVNNDN